MGYGRLTERKIRYIVRHRRRKSSREIAFEMRVSVSTVKGAGYCSHTGVFTDKEEGKEGEGVKRGEEGDHKGS